MRNLNLTNSVDQSRFERGERLEIVWLWRTVHTVPGLASKEARGLKWVWPHGLDCIRLSRFERGERIEMLRPPNRPLSASRLASKEASG